MNLRADRIIFFTFCILNSIWLSPNAIAKEVTDDSFEELVKESKPYLLSQGTKSKASSKIPYPKPKTPAATRPFKEDDSLFSWLDEEDDFSTDILVPQRKQRLEFAAYVNRIGPGLGANYRRGFNKKTEWGIGFSSNSASLLGTNNEEGRERIRISTQRLSIFSDYRKKDWLHWGGGISFQDLAGDYSWQQSQVAQPSSNFKAKILTFDAIFSSEWKVTDRFYLGVDWLSLSLPIVGSITVESNDALEDFTRFLTSNDIKTRVLEEIKSQMLIGYIGLRLGYYF